MEERIHLLLIDGSDADLATVERELRAADFLYRATHCGSDEEAIRAFIAKEDRPDAVLCPFSLPGINAVNVHDSLRGFGCDAPFILLAFDLAEDIAIELLESGMEDYVMRNSLKRLPVIIRKAIQRHETNMELRHSREQARSSEQAMRSMVNSTPMPVVMLDRELRFIVASETWYQQSNRVGAQLEGVHYSEVVPGQHEHWKRLQQECLQGKFASSDGESFEYEGKTYWTRWRMNPWYRGDGEVGGIVIFSENITEEKELVERLKRSEFSLKEAHRIAKLGSWSWRLGTSVVWCSEETIAMFGLDEEPGLVQWSEMLKRMHPDDREQIHILLQGDLLSQFSETLHLRVLMPDGSVRHIMSCAKVDTDDDGRPHRLIGTVQDQTADKLKEQEKEEARRLLDRIFASIPDAMMYADSERVIRWASDSVKDVFGYLPEEMVGDTTRKLYFNDEEYDRSGGDAFSTKNFGRPVTVQRRYRRKDGTVFSAETTGITILRPDGSIQGFIGSTRDISDRLEAERALRERNEQMELVMEVAHLGTWSWKCDTMTVNIDMQSAKIYGLEGSEASLLELSERMHLDDRDRVTNSLQKALVEKTLYTEEYRFTRPDGRVITLLDQGKAVYDDDGVPTYMHGIIIDRSERAELERAMLEREQLFRDMAENITEVFWLTDYQANRILYMSPQYEQVFGRTVESVYEVPGSWTDNIHPEDRPGIIEKFRQLAPAGEFDEEYRVVHPDGRLVWVRDRAFPIRDEQGNVLRIAGLSQDITREKLLREGR
jgi:PAS domain S-box-containing protein